MNLAISFPVVLMVCCLAISTATSQVASNNSVEIGIHDAIETDEFKSDESKTKAGVVELEVTKSTLVICPEGLFNALQPWIHLRESQGYNIIVKRPERTAYALSRSIHATAQKHELDHIVLVGDALNEAHPENIVPTDYVQAKVNVKFGSEPEIATDQTYCDFDSDGLPDIPIGRLCVDDSRQLKTLVEKIISYENNPDFGTWRRRIDLTAGTGGFGAVIDKVIETTAKHLITDLIPAKYETSITYASWTSPYCPDPRRFSKTTIGNINRGGLFWVYIGHGHPLRLDRLQVPGGQFPIFEEDDCSLLDCPSGQPIGLMLSCYTGAFDFQEDCMAEKMVAAKGGPIAMVTGTRVTMPYAMSMLSMQMMNDFFESGESLTLGQLVNRAKHRMLTSDEDNHYRQIIETLGKTFSPTSDLLEEELIEHVTLFHILGDPLLTLHRPKNVSLEVCEEVSNGDTLSVKGNSETAGLMTVELIYRRDRLTFRPQRRKEFVIDHDIFCDYQDTYDRANDRVCHLQQIQIHAGEFQVDIPVPKNAKGDCIVRAYVAGNDGFAMGHAETHVKRR